MTRHLVGWLMAASVVDAPRIGCWVEEQGQMPRVLYGVPGNLIVRDGEDAIGCATGERGVPEEDTGLARDATWTVFRLNDRWRIAVSRDAVFALHRRGSGDWEKYELPR